MFFLKFITLNYIIYKINSIYSIPFNIESSTNLDNNNILFTNILTTNLKLGNLKENTKFQIKFDTDLFIISTIDYKKINNSNSIETKEFVYHFNKYKSLIINDSISLKTYEKKITKINNINFYLSNDFNYNIFGFDTFSNPFHLFSLLFQLKNKNLIDSFTYSFDFFSDKKGEILIGDFPHNYNKKYDKNYLIQIKSQDCYLENYNNFVVFNLKVQKIIFGNFSDSDFNFFLDFNLFGIIGPYIFSKHIYNNYFEEYVNNSICKKIYLKNEFYFSFVCNKSIEIKNFPNFSFFVNNEKFFFKNQELFKLINNSYYFLVYFQKNVGLDWIFGQILIKKFKMVFNKEENFIGLYTKINNNKNIIINKNKIIIIILFLIIIILLLIVIYFAKKNLNKRKIFANELEDNFQYISKYNKL